MPRVKFKVKDNTLCVECQWNPVQQREKPDGNLCPPGIGYCIECRERRIRQFRNLHVNKNRLGEEGENVRLVF